MTRLPINYYRDKPVVNISVDFSSINDDNKLAIVIYNGLKKYLVRQLTSLLELM